MESNSQANFDILLSAIKRLQDTDGNNIEYSHLEVKYTKLRFSSTYANILFIDDEPCSGNKRNYKVTYQCRCGRIHTILLRKFLLKDKLVCRQCNQVAEFGGIGHNNPNRPSILPIKSIPKNFLNEPDEFLRLYFEKHLTQFEFSRWLSVIIQINNTVLDNAIKANITYIPHAPCSNQQKYTSYVIINGHKESLKQVYLQCGICGKIHSVHVENLKNKNPDNIKCRFCALCNTRFPIRKYGSSGITYQSALEQRFLDICFQHNIVVENGPKIPYFWNNKNRQYIVDFYLPEYKHLIEIKAENIYYHMQKNNGKFDEKYNAAIKYANTHNMEYKLLFDNDIDSYFLNLKR